MLLAEITMEEFDRGLARTRTVVVPFGSVEEHGRHLPLGTDTLQIYALARLASERRPLFVAPPVFYGLCRSTREHPGTVTIRGETLRALALDLLEDLFRQGLRCFLLLSGHAGGTHMAFLVDAGEEFLARHQEARVAVASILDLLRACALDLLETEGDSHAGELETSLMLHFFPELVKGTSPEEYPSFPKMILVRDKRRFWAGGVWGDPARASAEKGELFARRLADGIVRLAETLEEMEDL